MRWLKYVAIALGGLLALLLVAVVALFALVDTAALKTTLSKYVADQYQRTLTLDGDLKLSLFPTLGVSVAQARLSEPGATATALKVEQARLSVDVLPLLRGQLRVGGITLDGLEATLVRKADGKTNYDDLIGGDKKQSSGAVQFDIEKIALTRSALVVRDAVSGTDLTLSQLNLSTGRVAERSPFPFDFSVQIQGKKPAIQGAFKAKGVATFDLTGRAFSLSKFETGYSGKLGADTIEASVNLPQLSLSADATQALELRAMMKVTGARQLEARLVAEGVSGKPDAVSIKLLSLNSKGSQGQQNFVFDLKTPLTADLNALLIRLPQFSGQLQVNDPSLPMKSLQVPLSGTLTADLKQQKMQGKLNTKFDDTTLAAQWGVQQFSPLKFTFDINADRLNVDRYLPPPAANTPAASGAEKPIDLSALKKLNGSGTARIGQLQIKGMKASNVLLTLNANAGDVRLAPVSAQLYGGSLQATASVNAHSNRYALNQQLNNVQIGPLLRDVAKNDLLEGRAVVNANVTATGTTVSALKKALNGTASVRLNDGAIKGYDLGKTLGNARDKLNALVKGGTTNDKGGGSAQDKTQFSELSASFNIVNGVANNDDLNVKAPLFRLGGNGKIDLGESRVDYLARASIVNTLTGQGGKDKGQTRDITIPVKIVGPFDKLGWEVQWSAVGSEALKATVGTKLDEKKQELKDKARDQVKDKLKGLFSR
ncbi:MAG: AsmA family protein [Burkholderiales bacterium]